MSTAYPIQANNRTYLVVDDCSTSWIALITGLVTDEILGSFDASGFAVTADRGGVGFVAKETGLYAITGRPDQAFPKLHLADDAVNLALSAPGFRSHTLKVVIRKNASFPVIATPVALRRLPVLIQGRVVSKTNRQPIAGASIVAIDNPITPPAVHTLVLRSPLYLPHADTTAIQSATITPGGGAQLNEDTPTDGLVITLSTRTGLGPNAIVQLSNASQTIVEYAVVDHLGSGAANQPGTVFLKQPLNRSYPAGVATTVQFVTATPTGAPAQLNGDADAGDGVVLASQLLTGNTVVIDSGNPATVEYHELNVLTDADGYYLLCGVGRVREIFLQAVKGLTKSASADWYLQFERNVNIVNFLL